MIATTFDISTFLSSRRRLGSGDRAGHASPARRAAAPGRAGIGTPRPRRIRNRSCRLPGRVDDRRLAVAGADGGAERHRAGLDGRHAPRSASGNRLPAPARASARPPRTRPDGSSFSAPSSFTVRASLRRHCSASAPWPGAGRRCSGSIGCISAGSNSSVRFTPGEREDDRVVLPFGRACAAACRCCRGWAR